MERLKEDEMNNVVLMGRLTKDPEIMETANTTIATYTLAVDRRTKGEADFIRCKAFGKDADFIGKYFAKGKRVAVSGRIQTGSYTSKEGKTVYTTDVITNIHEFAESKNAGFEIVDETDELPFK